MNTWMGKNVPVIVTGGQYAGRRGRLVRALGRGEWLVKLDDRFFGSTVEVRHLQRDLEA